MATPALSVILPNYNHADFLPRCLDAFLGQSFSDFELIVVDDGSTDGSVELLEAYARRDPRIRLYRNPENRGVAYTLNRALSYATGTYLHGAAADDYILPGYFQAAMDMLGKHPGAGICLGLTQCVNDKGHTVDVVPGEWSTRPEYLSPDEFCERITNCGIPGPAVWRRDAFLQAGGYNPELRWHCDWFALQVVAFRHGLCFIPERFTVVRMTQGSYSNGQHQPAAQRPVLQVLLRLLRKPEYRDVLPMFQKSDILRLFGVNLVRAAVTLEDPLDDLRPCLRQLFFPHATNLLRDPSPDVRRGTAQFLAGYGRESLGFEGDLSALARDRISAVAGAAVAAWASIWKATPFPTRLRYRARRVLGKALRAFDRHTRPIHHERLDRLETMLSQLLSRNIEILGGINGSVVEIRRHLEELRQEATPPADDWHARNAAA